MAIAGAVALKVLVDPEHLKQLARDKARQAWARDLKVADISFELLPLPALRIHDLRLDHPTEPPIVAKAVTVDLELLPLLIGQVRYRSAWFSEATITWDGSPWRIEEAVIEANPRMRDVSILGSLWRNGKAVGVKARFEDLSALGKPGAASMGRVELDWESSKLVAAGRFPLDGTIRGYGMHVDVKSDSLVDICNFFGLKNRPRAPFTAQFDIREREGRVEVSDAALSLGLLKVKGDAVHTPGAKPFTSVRLRAERLDWARTYLDMGGELMPPPKPPEMFHDTPLAWWAITGLEGKKGTIEADFGTLILRNGVELQNLKAKMAYDDGKLDMTSFTTGMLGGTASGSIHLDGRRKAVRFNFEGTNLLLERWFKERGAAVRFTGGPMKISAKLASSGNSMRQIVGALSGPFDIRMGRGVLANPRAGAAEAKLTGGDPEERRDIQFECVGYALRFAHGRASGDPIIGARTPASHLLTSGWVDMGKQTLDLRGRLKTTSGVGLATILGDLKITGPIRRPKTELDDSAVPKALARGAAAIATLGLSVVGTAAADSAEARRNDPCEAVFKRK
jgi:hypothetical protein